MSKEKHTVTLPILEYEAMQAELLSLREAIQEKETKIFTISGYDHGYCIHIMNPDEATEFFRKEMEAAAELREVIIKNIPKPKRSDKYAAEDAMHTVIKPAIDKTKYKNEIWNFIFRKFWYKRD